MGCWWRPSDRCTVLLPGTTAQQGARRGASSPPPRELPREDSIPPHGRPVGQDGPRQPLGASQGCQRSPDSRMRRDSHRLPGGPLPSVVGGRGGRGSSVASGQCALTVTHWPLPCQARGLSHTSLHPVGSDPILRQMVGHPAALGRGIRAAAGAPHTGAGVRIMSCPSAVTKTVRRQHGRDVDSPRRPVPF